MKSIDKSAAAREDLYVRLYQIIRRWQRGNRFIATALGSSLSLIESHVLLEIDADREQSIGALALLFGMEQSSISRSVQKLQKSGYLKITRARDDARRRSLTVTDRGKAALSAIDRAVNAIIKKPLAGFAAPEREILQDFLAAFLDGMGVPVTPLRKTDVPLRVIQRRTARAFNVLGESAFLSGLVSSHFQILCDVAASKTATFRSVSRGLSLPTNTAAGAIAALMKKKLLATGAGSVEGRKLSCTRAGHDLLRATEGRAVVKIRKALHHLPEKRIRRGVELLSRYVDSLGEEIITVRPGTYLRAARAEETQALRAFLAEHAVAQRQHLYLPARLCGAEDLCLVLLHGEDRRAIFQFALDRDQPTLTAMARDAGKCPRRLLKSALRSACAEIKRRTSQLPAITFPL